MASEGARGPEAAAFQGSQKVVRSPPGSRRGSFASSVGSEASTRQGKRARVEDVDAPPSPLGVLKGIQDEVRTYIFDDKSKVSKTACEFIVRKMNECQEILTEQLLRNERLQGSVECLERMLKDARDQKSYASASKDV